MIPTLFMESQIVQRHPYEIGTSDSVGGANRRLIVVMTQRDRLELGGMLPLWTGYDWQLVIVAIRMIPEIPIVPEVLVHTFTEIAGMALCLPF